MSNVNEAGAKNNQVHTPGEWTVKETTSKEYPSHIDYSIHVEEIQLHTDIKNDTSPLWNFRPHIASVNFGRSNEERSANAKLIAAAPEMLRILKELQQAFIHVEGDTKGNKTRTDIFKNCPEFRKLAADTRNAIEKATT